MARCAAWRGRGKLQSPALSLFMTAAASTYAAAADDDNDDDGCCRPAR